MQSPVGKSWSRLVRPERRKKVQGRIVEMPSELMRGTGGLGRASKAIVRAVAYTLKRNSRELRAEGTWSGLLSAWGHNVETGL